MWQEGERLLERLEKVDDVVALFDAGQVLHVWHQRRVRLGWVGLDHISVQPATCFTCDTRRHTPLGVPQHTRLYTRLLMPAHTHAAYAGAYGRTWHAKHTYSQIQV